MGNFKKPELYSDVGGIIEGKTVAIVLAGGKGTRFGSKPKQFETIGGKTILEHSLDTFEKHPLIDEIVIVNHPNNDSILLKIVEKNNYRKLKAIVSSGGERQASSKRGVECIANRNDIENVLIHSSARPFVSNKTISRIIEALKTYSAVGVAVPSTNTIVTVNEKQIITDIPQRKYLFTEQSPEGFRKDTIVTAHQLATKEGYTAPDDCGLVLQSNLCSIYVVEGDKLNIKITYADDLQIAKKIYKILQGDKVEDADSKLEEIKAICNKELAWIQLGAHEVVPEDTAMKAGFKSTLNKINEIIGK